MERMALRRIVAIGLVALACAFPAWGGREIDHMYILVTPWLDTGPSAIIHFDVDGDTLVQRGSYPTGGLGCEGCSAKNILIDSERNLLIVPNRQSNDISVFEIETDGSLAVVPGSPFSTSSPSPPTPRAGPYYIALHPGLPVVYVAQYNPPGPASIGAYLIAPDNTLTFLQSVSSSFARDLEVEPGGQFLYVAHMARGVRAFAITPTGSLMELPESPFGFDFSRPNHVDMTSDGQHLFVVDVDEGIGVFNIQSDGVPQQLPGSPISISSSPISGFATDVEVSDDDQFLYISTIGSGIRTYSIGEDGTPTELPTSPISSSGRHEDLLAPRGTGRLYHVVSHPNQIRRFAISDDGSPVLLGQVNVIDLEGRDTGAAAYLAASSMILSLDIKPGSCPNPFNRNSDGFLPVALLGGTDIDVMTVDLGSVQLSRADGVGGSVAPNEGPRGPHSVFADVGTPFEGEICGCHELGGDGITDLSMKFRRSDISEVLELNDFALGSSVELVLSGVLLDGTPFSAYDCI